MHFELILPKSNALVEIDLNLFLSLLLARVSPSIEMNNLTSNQNTNEIDEHARPAGAIQHHLTVMEVPSIFQDETSDKIVRLYSRVSYFVDQLKWSYSLFRLHFKMS